MPLFVPAESLSLTYSERLVSGTTRFYAASPEVVLEAVDESLVQPMVESSEVARYAGLRSERRSRRTSETAAYANLLLGKLRKARRLLKLAQAPDVFATWEWTVIERARLIEGLLGTDGPGAALAQLEAWSSENRARFKLMER